MSLLDIACDVANCEQCVLHKTRNHTVFGAGNPDANLIFVGEAPGANEDNCATPFVGISGKILTNMIASIGLIRDEVYICNAVKCRPPDNRDPTMEEISECSDWLRMQVQEIRPIVMCTLGLPAYKALNPGAENPKMGEIRGRIFNYYYRHYVTSETMIVPVVPTFHPAYLHRNPSKKKEAFEDLKKIKELLNG